MGYRLLCLDAGFTLLSPRPTLVDALSGVLLPDGRPITEDDLRAAWEESDRWFWDEYHRPDNDTWTDDGRIEGYWRRYHSILLGRLGVEARGEVLDRVLASQFSTDAWELYADVEPMLAEVRAIGGVAIGIVSDWGSNLRAIVDGLGLDRSLDFVLSSGSVGVAKPNPAFFRMALDRARVAAENALMVGDSYRADVRGAWAAGMDAIWLNRSEGISITPEGEPEPTDARIIRSLDELPQIVRAGGPLPRGKVSMADQPATA